MPEASRTLSGRARRCAASLTTRTMLRLLLLQLSFGAVVALLLWGTSGPVPGYSAALGALTSVLPNAFLALRLAVPRNDAEARPLMRAAFTGELGKLALTVILFTVILTLVRPLAYGSLFAGFVAAQLAIIAGVFVTAGDTGNLKARRSDNGE